MNICVQGLWHLGTVTAACMAAQGCRVFGLDYDQGIINELRRGTPPLFEPGLEKLVQQGLATEQLSFHIDPVEATKDIEILWIAYDTPVDDDDGADVDFVIEQIKKTLPCLADKTTVIISSQMPVGSVRKLEAYSRINFPEKRLGFACSPENLRLGKALDIFLKPDRIVVGVRTSEDREKIENMLKPLSARIEWMSIESAEMTKHAINAFLATSVTFANEMAAVCELVGADAKEVERGLKTESRIGPKAYLSPGGAFAGGTLARDIIFLNHIGAEQNLITPLLSSVKASNDEHKKWIRRKLFSVFPDRRGLSVTVWGLTYKPGTDTLRRSMAVELCDWLISQEIPVCVHDPQVKTLPPEWQGKVRRVNGEIESLHGAQALIVSTEWPQYKDISVDAIVGAAPGITIFDANRFLIHCANDARLKYVAVGTPN